MITDSISGPVNFQVKLLNSLGYKCVLVRCWRKFLRENSFFFLSFSFIGTNWWRFNDLMIESNSFSDWFENRYVNKNEEKENVFVVDLINLNKRKQRKTNENRKNNPSEWRISDLCLLVLLLFFWVQWKTKVDSIKHLRSMETKIFDRLFRPSIYRIVDQHIRLTIERMTKKKIEEQFNKRKAMKKNLICHCNSRFRCC